MFDIGNKSYALRPAKTTPVVTYSVTLQTYKLPQNWYSGINICILGKNNTAFLHRIQPYPIIQKGRPHTTTFDAHDVGDIDAIIVAPETGSLALDEVQVAVPSREIHSRFLCGEEIGGHHSHEGAAFLKPMFKLTPEKKAEYDLDYLNMKNALNFGTLQLAVLGSVLTGCALGLPKALAFSLGALLSMSYFQMLQYEVDRIGEKHSFLPSVARLAVLFATAGAIVAHYHNDIIQDNSYFIIGFLGFITYKISIMRFSINRGDDGKD